MKISATSPNGLTEENRSSINTVACLAYGQVEDVVSPFLEEQLETAEVVQLAQSESEDIQAFALYRTHRLLNILGGEVIFGGEVTEVMNIATTPELQSAGIATSMLKAYFKNVSPAGKYVAAYTRNNMMLGMLARLCGGYKEAVYPNSFEPGQGRDDVLLRELAKAMPGAETLHFARDYDDYRTVYRPGYYPSEGIYGVDPESSDDITKILMRHKHIVLPMGSLRLSDAMVMVGRLREGHDHVR